MGSSCIVVAPIAAILKVLLRNAMAATSVFEKASEKSSGDVGMAGEESSKLLRLNGHKIKSTLLVS